MSGSGVQTRALEMHYRVGTETVRALDKVDLDVPSGQFVIVRGRSGSGKTTLLHLIAGLQRPSAGSIRIGEHEIQSMRTVEVDAFRRRNIGLIFQFFNLIPALTVEMNIALPLLLEGQRLPHLASRVEALVDTLGLSHRRRHAPTQLSGGEMQRVAIARALIVEPKVILADEPTGNLDSRNAHEVFRLLREQSEERGVTTLVMTHDIDVTGYADRVIEMGDGRIESDSGRIPVSERLPE